MKRLTCEMCGSTNLVKENGVFVCQSCGVKYSVEEAKKMMIEGVVEVTGTVKIDNTEELANFYQLARRAKSEGNIENAARYYDLILQKRPDDWEAQFYSVYYQSMSVSVEKIQSVAITITNCAVSTLQMLKNAEREKQYEAINEIVEKLDELVEVFVALSNKDYLAKLKQSQNIGGIKFDYEENCKASIGILYRVGESIKEIFVDDVELLPLAIKAWESCNRIAEREKVAKLTVINCTRNIMELKTKSLGTEYTLRDSILFRLYGIDTSTNIVQLHNGEATIQFDEQELKIFGKYVINMINVNCEEFTEDYKNITSVVLYKDVAYIGTENKEKAVSIRLLCGRYDKDRERFDYAIEKLLKKNPKVKIEKHSSLEASGCYVATCVYGSYDCPEVWTLRRYRDDTLGATWYGRAFIRTYYAISPTLVKWFGKTKWFKKMWKGKLDRMVKKLQDKGVENTPYEDKDWK